MGLNKVGKNNYVIALPAKNGRLVSFSPTDLKMSSIKSVNKEITFKQALKIYRRWQHHVRFQIGSRRGKSRRKDWAKPPNAKQHIQLIWQTNYRWASEAASLCDTSVKQAAINVPFASLKKTTLGMHCPRKRFLFQVMLQDSLAYPPAAGKWWAMVISAAPFTTGFSNAVPAQNTGGNSAIICRLFLNWPKQLHETDLFQEK